MPDKVHPAFCRCRKCTGPRRIMPLDGPLRLPPLIAAGALIVRAWRAAFPNR